jgi:hypothetical protein
MSEDELKEFQWTVEYYRELIPFPNFAAAVSYADALVLKGTLVKVINPMERRIAVVARQQSEGHSDEIIDELAGGTRRRRGAD